MASHQVMSHRRHKSGHNITVVLVHLEPELRLRWGVAEQAVNFGNERIGSSTGIFEDHSITIHVAFIVCCTFAHKQKRLHYLISAPPQQPRHFFETQFVLSISDLQI